MSPDDRMSELRALAEQRSIWRGGRRDVVLSFGSVLHVGEGIAELRASQDDDDPTVVLVSDQRVLVGRRGEADRAASIESLDFDELVTVEVGADVAGSLKFTTRSGPFELHRFSARDSETIAAAIGQRLRRRARSGPRRQERKPVTDLEMLESLRRSGVLTEPEFQVVRARVLQEIAVRDDGRSSGEGFPRTP